MRNLFLAICLCATPMLCAQSLLDEKVSVQFKRVTLFKCLMSIQKESGVSFSYNSKLFQGIDKTITASFEDEPLRNILDYLFSETKLQYKEIGNQITIYMLNSGSEKVVISGYIQDKKSGEDLIGARISFPEYGVGCIANSYGYYALEVPKGTTHFRVSSLGMLTLEDEVQIDNEMVMNIRMDLDTLVLNVIEVVSEQISKETEIADLPRLDKITITPTAISRVPAASGERDLLRHIQQLPGVQPANDGGANFVVRGSGTGGNLILIDEIPIYHPTHLLGIYSVINADALRSATLHKDYIPPQYGSRSASVLRIHTKEGDLNSYHISGGASGFMARLNFEGPIVKQKASFYTSGRVSTFPGALLSILNNRQLGNPSFYDLNGKVNMKVNSNNRIYFTSYVGRDGLTDTVSNYQWGNVALGFRWNQVINTKTFSNLGITHSVFAYGFSRADTSENLNFGQKVVTDKLSYDFTHYLNNSTKIDYGFSTTYLRTSKGNFRDKDANLFLKRQSLENGVYVAVDKKINRKLNVKMGLRIPFSFHLGTGDTTAYINRDYVKTQVVYQKNKLYDPVFFIDPRFVGTYRIGLQDELQLAAMITSQNTHIINYINYFLPVEIWTPSTSYLKPERNFQASLGWTHSGKNFQTSAVLYHKYVRNVLDYASPVFTSSVDIESNLLAGYLNASGLELMLNYAVTTWYSASISYTYSRTRQEIKGINNDEPYVAPSDRPHYLAISQYINLSKKWQITTNYITHSGTAITLPNGQFIIDGTAFPLYSSNRNTERLPRFSRVDLSFRRQLGVKKNRTNWDMTFTITNFFNRYNPSVAYVEHEFNNPEKLIIQSVDYSPVMISLNVSFRY